MRSTGLPKVPDLVKIDIFPCKRKHYLCDLVNNLSSDKLKAVS